MTAFFEKSYKNTRTKLARWFRCETIVTFIFLKNLRHKDSCCFNIMEYIDFTSFTNESNAALSQSTTETGLRF